MTRLVRAAFFVMAAFPIALQAQRPVKVFISVDMEGIGGIGTAAMTNASGKDYQLGRRTARAIRTRAPALLPAARRG